MKNNFLKLFLILTVTLFGGCYSYAADLLPVLKQRFFDENGNPLAGGKLYSYEAGTTTPKATYSDQEGLVPNTNPVILNANGEANIYINAEKYKFVLKDMDDVLQYTVDDVTLPSVNALASAFWREVKNITSADSPYTVTQDDNGKLIVANTTSGAVTVNLPEMSSIEAPFNVGVKQEQGSNAVTINRSGSDVIDGAATSKSTTAAGVGFQFAADKSTSPDKWSSFELGTAVDNSVSTAKIQDEAVTAAKLATAVRNLLMPVGMIAPFAGTSCPTSWISADGSPVSRTTYSDLYAFVGTKYGSGDGSTTFNLPDFRYKTIRGYGPNTSVAGTGTAGSNQATFTAHGFTHTGIKVRLSSGTLSGLSTATDYFVIVVNANTLSFATTRANAIAGTAAAISGANSAVIVQYEDPDIASRDASAPGGQTGANVGSVQDDAFQGHGHRGGIQGGTGSNASVTSGGATGGYSGSATYNIDVNSLYLSATGMGTPRDSGETRMKNASALYCIKY